MKLPVIVHSPIVQHAAEHSQFYSAASLRNPAMPGVEMNGILDFLGPIGDVIGGALGKVPCILSKVGPQGVACLTQCGPNPACLASCAGPGAVQAILGCM